jgi:C-terminal processing protease CtpA/Prc
MVDLGIIDNEPGPRRRRGEGAADADALEGSDSHLPLREAMPLRAFLRKRRRLSLGECRRLVQQALVLFESVYVHLPLKRSMYAVDPVRRLRLLEHRLRQHAEQQRATRRPERVDDLWFHREMSEIFTSVRDLHTVYLLPQPFEGAVALLPFQVEDYFVGGQRRYMVSNVLKGLPWFAPPADFRAGVEITHWNGIPIARAVELAGAQNQGSNPEARHARGLARFTIRPLLKSVPPDEEWVDVEYRVEGGKDSRSLRVEWHVADLPEGRDPPPDGAALRQPSGLRRAMGRGFDPETTSIGGVKKRLWAPDVLEAENRDAARRRRPSPQEREAPAYRVEADRRFESGRVIRSGMPGIFQAKIREVDGKEFGYIRLRSFNVDDADEFVAEFVALVERMPPNGLIVDVRDNGGGNIEAGERILQVLTPRRIEPERLQFINTPLNLRLCRRFGDLEPWVDSMERAIQTGSTFSAGFPHSDPELCNAIGQRYYGPVLLVTNALCYSTTDIFAAGFQDHEIGRVLGTDGNTGAGGANVVSHGDLIGMLEARKGVQLRDSPFRPLPGGANLRVAIRRTLRVGRRSGTELEDIGVTPDIPYRMTREDVLRGNVDLIARAASILAKKRVYDLREEEIGRADGKLAIKVRTLNLDRLDLSIDGWAAPSQPVADGAQTLPLALPPGGRARLLEMRGYRKGKLAAARKVPLE